MSHEILIIFRCFREIKLTSRVIVITTSIYSW